MLNHSFHNKAVSLRYSLPIHSDSKLPETSSLQLSSSPASGFSLAMVGSFTTVQYVMINSSTLVSTKVPTLTVYDSHSSQRSEIFSFAQSQ